MKRRKSRQTTNAEVIYSNKVTRHRISMIRNKVDVMIHYWKVRCRERHALAKTMRTYVQSLNKLRALQKSLGSLLNRRSMFILHDGAHKKVRHYPVFLTHNDIQRLRQMLSRLHSRHAIKPRKGMKVLWLNKYEYAHMKWVLRKAYNKKVKRGWPR